MSVLVYGGGVPALAAALELTERGIPVHLVGPTEAARHPHLPAGGLVATDAALDDLGSIGEAWVEELHRMGVPFHRDGADLARRRLPGWDEPVAAYVDGRTATAIAWALDEQLARRQRDGAAIRRETDKDLVELVADDGRVVGAVLRDRVTHALEGVTAAAVLLATTGRPGMLAGATASMFPERAIAAAFRAGATLSGSGQARLSPTLLAHGRRLQPLSNALRAEGARLWVPVDDKEARLPRDIPPSDRDHFAEESLGDDAAWAKDGPLAELVAEVTAERGIWDRRERESRGTAYLDLSHLPEGHLRPRLGDELDAIAARAPRSPFVGPMEVRAGAVSLGASLSVDDEHRTSLDGLWAAGDAADRYLGASPQGGVALLAALEGARRAAQGVEVAPAHRDGVVQRAVDALGEPDDEVDAEGRDTLAAAMNDLALGYDVTLEDELASLGGSDAALRDAMMLARAIARLRRGAGELRHDEIVEEPA